MQTIVNEIPDLEGSLNREAVSKNPFELPPFYKPIYFSPDNRNYKASLSRLAPESSLSFVLDGSFWCDCHDLSALPRVYRLHMYMGGISKDVGYDVKLDRMTKWQDAIVFYGSRMTDAFDQTPKQTMDLINTGYIPRADIVELETGTTGLIKLFHRLGYDRSPDLPRPFVVSWERILGDAQSGKIVTEWVKQKGEQTGALDAKPVGL